MWIVVLYNRIAVLEEYGRGFATSEDARNWAQDYYGDSTPEYPWSVLPLTTAKDLQDV